MADKKISELTNITGANLADGDELVVVDASESETKAITFGEFKTALDTSTGFVRITGDAMTGDLSFGDNDKAIFGAGSDLQIYHDGLHSYIDEAGTGDIYVSVLDDIIFRTYGTNELVARFNTNQSTGGWARLYHRGSEKLETTSTGVDITGTLTSDGLTVDGDAVFSNGDNSILNGDDFAKIQLKSIDSSTNSTGIMSEIADVALANFDGASNNHELVIRTNNGLAATGTLKDRISIANNGDISFYEDTGTTAKFFWDASAERLGIGTSSPSAPLEVDGGSDIAFFDGTNVRLKIQNPSTGVLQLNSSGAGDSLSFATVDTERMRIDSSGRVGIGMSSPSSLLHLKGSTSKITLEDSDVAGATCIIQGGGAGNLTLAADPDDAVASSYITFQVDASEAMRIDSSGNLLVGKTSSSFGTTGIELQGDGELISTRAGTTAYFNRTSTDGDIVGFYKDGTTVGSIGSYGSGSGMYIGTGDTGIAFNSTDDNVFPRNPSTNLPRDNAIDLGSSSARFKDLYLSNAVRLGDAVLQEINGTDPFLSGNAYYNGSTWNYLTSTDAANYYQTGGQHIWRSAASGTAGNTISWSEAMRIDSSGNVGIGTSSPSADYGSDIALEISGATSPGIVINDTGQASKYGIHADSNDLKITYGSGALATFQNDGNVGIGTSSPKRHLHINDPSAVSTKIQITNSATGSGSDGEGFQLGIGSTGQAAIEQRENQPLTFSTNNSERMRIDSSGNLLVGKTASSLANDGFQAHNTGYIGSTNSGASTAYFNRKTNDGDIVNFQKDGSTVGSIGYESAGTYIDGETNHSGLSFQAPNITPRYNGSITDDTVHLGSSSNRFKDLYLSGGVYLGGTGAANKLDDYEEGTFSPSFNGVSSNPSVTYTSQNGVYVKVGNLVYISIALGWSAFSGGSGNIRVGGLPFQPNGGNTMRAVGSIPYVDAFTGLTNAYGVEPHTNIASAAAGTYFYYKGSNGNITDYIFPSDIKSSGALQVCLVYRTD